MSCTSARSDKGDHRTAGLEGGGGGRVSPQLDQLRYNEKLHLEFSEGFCWNWKSLKTDLFQNNEKLLED